MVRGSSTVTLCTQGHAVPAHPAHARAQLGQHSLQLSADTAEWKDLCQSMCVCVGFRRHPPLLEEVLWCRRSLLYVRTLNLRKDTTTSPGNLVAGRRGGAPSCWSGTWELDMTGADTCVHAVTSKGSLSVPFSF